MQAYTKHFAQVYNLMWGNFANNYAPRIRELFESSPLAKTNQDVLDLCCGTGQLSKHFLEAGYRLVGLDLSAYMLDHARQNCLDFIVAEQAEFIHGDAADFQMEQKFGLVISLFDALNHLPGETALRSCFRCCLNALVEGGTFIFDLNTIRGLQNWNGVNIHNTEEIFLLNRAIYDQLTIKAWTKITGFMRTENGLYERFDETVYNTVFEMQAVMDWLLEAGFGSAYFASGSDLSTPIGEPEQEQRIFFVAQK
jgi:SAM-dependent methyltransferase